MKGGDEVRGSSREGDLPIAGLLHVTGLKEKQHMVLSMVV